MNTSVTADGSEGGPQPIVGAPAALGQTLDGRWTVMEIHQGGQGWVLIVEGEAAQGRRAIKLPLAGGQVGDGELAMLLAVEPHPYIVNVLDEIVIDGRRGILLEYVPGTLGEMLRRHHSLDSHGGEQGMTPRLPDGLGTVLQQICIGMAHLSRATELAHLDLKPSNVLIDGVGHAKIADFGLAQHVGMRDGRFLAARGGTWAYAAPEVLRGEPCDSRADIFSFGVLMYEICTGRLPYPFPLAVDSPAQRRQLCDYYDSGAPRQRTEELYYSRGEAAVEVPRLIGDEQLRIFLSSCLQLDAAQRPESFERLLSMLGRALGRPAPSVTAVGLDTLDRWTRDLSRARALNRLGRAAESVTLLNLLLTEPLPAALQGEAVRAAQVALIACGRHEDADAIENW
ncbi:serine/threonine-protein kinase [Streptomyces sp. NPDC004232]|uniref:serine/threonine-protein kinase n=1 Tax=Streptomyces sp. NPDC004232 TaxID=3154454 RepID=UPI0033B9E129